MDAMTLNLGSQPRIGALQKMKMGGSQNMR